VVPAYVITPGVVALGEVAPGVFLPLVVPLSGSVTLPTVGFPAVGFPAVGFPVIGFPAVSVLGPVSLSAIGPTVAARAVVPLSHVRVAGVLPEDVGRWPGGPGVLRRSGGAGVLRRADGAGVLRRAGRPGVLRRAGAVAGRPVADSEVVRPPTLAVARSG